MSIRSDALLDGTLQDPPLITDTLQRPLRDLCISVTDLRNLRCTYCMPREFFDTHHVFLPRAELLSFEVIGRSEPCSKSILH